MPSPTDTLLNNVIFLSSWKLIKKFRQTLGSTKYNDQTSLCNKIQWERRICDVASLLDHWKIYYVTILAHRTSTLLNKPGNNSHSQQFIIPCPIGSHVCISVVVSRLIIKSTHHLVTPIKCKSIHCHFLKTPCILIPSRQWNIAGPAHFLKNVSYSGFRWKTYSF